MIKIKAKNLFFVGLLILTERVIGKREQGVVWEVMPGKRKERE